MRKSAMASFLTGRWMKFKGPKRLIWSVSMTWMSNLEAGDVVAGKHGNAFSFDNARQTLLQRA